MDLGPTLCEIARAPLPPVQDGLSLAAALRDGEIQKDRHVFSELLDCETPARMVRCENWKYISYAGMEEHDQLFDMDRDRHEYHNCIERYPEMAKEMRHRLRKGWDPDEIVRDMHRRRGHWELLSKWGAAVNVSEPHRWKVPESSWALPEP